jgi:hypothetical protein
MIMFLKASNYKALQFLSDMCVQVVSEYKATDRCHPTLNEKHKTLPTTSLET